MTEQVERYLEGLVRGSACCHDLLNETLLRRPGNSVQTPGRGNRSSSSQNWASKSFNLTDRKRLSVTIQTGCSNDVIQAILNSGAKRLVRGLHCFKQPTCSQFIALKTLSSNETLVCYLSDETELIISHYTWLSVQIEREILVKTEFRGHPKNASIYKT